MANDLVFKLDQQQAIGSPTAIKCPKDETHGNLCSDISGLRLLCACGVVIPASFPTSE